MHSNLQAKPAVWIKRIIIPVLHFFSFQFRPHTISEYILWLTDSPMCTKTLFDTHTHKNRLSPYYTLKISLEYVENVEVCKP